MSDVVTPHIILDFFFHFMIHIWKFKILFFSTYKLNVGSTNEEGSGEAEVWGCGRIYYYCLHIDTVLARNHFGTLGSVWPLKIVGSEVLIAVVMKSSISWDITPCSPFKRNWCFEGTYYLHLQSQRRALLSTCFHARFLFCLLFDPEDGGDMFLWNIRLQGVISQKIIIVLSIESCAKCPNWAIISTFE
jgi:hypothetical protein